MADAPPVRRTQRASTGVGEAPCRMKSWAPTIRTQRPDDDGAEPSSLTVSEATPVKTVPGLTPVRGHWFQVYPEEQTGARQQRLRDERPEHSPMIVADRASPPTLAVPSL